MDGRRLFSEILMIIPYSSIAAVLTFLAGFINLSLGVIVLLKSRRSHTQLLFFLICFALFLWCSVIGSLYLNIWQIAFLQTVKWVLLIALPIPLLTILFSDAFPDRKPVYSAFHILLLCLPAVILAGLIIGKTIISSELAGHTIVIRLGDLRNLFSLYILAYFSIAGFIFFRNYRTATAIEKTKYNYFFAGILVTTVMVVVFNLILVNLFGIVHFIFFGPLGTIFLLGATAYAITKYRLMNISLVIKKTTAYSLVTSAITFVYVLIVVAFEFLFRFIYGYYSFWASIPAALVIAVTFAPMRERLQTVTDKLFFRRTVEYQNVIKEVTRLIASVTNLNTLFRLIDRTILRAMCVKNVAIMLYEERKNMFLVEKTNGHPQEFLNITFEPGNSLIAYMEEKKDAVVLDEIKALRSSGNVNAAEKVRLNGVCAALEKLESVVAIPSFSRDKLVGILCLGEKLSGEPYSPDDLGLLLTMASESGVAIENAKLYRDITETRDYLNGLVQGSDDAIITLDLQGRILSWNEGARSIFGYAAAEVIGRTPPFFTDKETEELVNKILQSKNIKAIELGKKGKHGREVPLLLTASPIRDTSGSVLGVSAILKDITELKKVNQLKHEVLSVISHELRTPLTPIKGYLSLILSGQMGQITTEQIKALNIISNQSDHLADLIDSLIDISRVEAGKPLELLKEPQFLDDIVKESLSASASTFAAKAIQVETNYPSYRMAIMADRKKLMRVMDNLLSNALKFTPANGWVKVSFEKGDKEIKVVVADSGIGLAPEHLEKIFESFFQIDTSYTRSIGGIGMGLTLAREIIGAHDGRIWAESNGLGKGSRLCFTLPIS
ncbi:MAG: PAS domain S-box protein [Candidatus Margulisbacteria bacterium]|nr:PAS domain S-box protein [Candidatus Margulisiibacteriota bacterium]